MGVVPQVNGKRDPSPDCLMSFVLTTTGFPAHTSVLFQQGP